LVSFLPMNTNGPNATIATNSDCFVLPVPTASPLPGFFENKIPWGLHLLSFSPAVVPALSLAFG